MAEIKPLINFNNVFLRYGNNPEILKDINLQIHKGDFLFLVGESGAGKTTLLNMMNLSLVPTRGQLEILNHSTFGINHKKISTIRRKIGIIFQDFKLLNHLTAFDNIALPLKISGVSTREINNRVNELLSWINLKDYANYFPLELSGGQQQCIAIARAIINNPDIILADEPTGNLDYKMESKILSLLQELNKQGVAIIFATHNLDLMKKYNHPIGKLENNKLHIQKQQHEII